MLEGWGKATGLIPTFYRPTHNVAGNSPERHTHTNPSDYTFFSPFHPNPSIWNLDELLLWHLLGLISYLCSWHALFLYILVESLLVHFGANGAWIKADISISLSYRLFYYSSFQRHLKKKKRKTRSQTFFLTFGRDFPYFLCKERSWQWISRVFSNCHSNNKEDCIPLSVLSQNKWDKE